MALQSGRVGVASDQVDVFGKVKAAGSSSNMEIRVNEEDQPQWRKKGTEDWQNFSSGALLGWNVPDDRLELHGMTRGDSKCVLNGGGYFEEDGVYYFKIDMTLTQSVNNDLWWVENIPYTGNPSNILFAQNKATKLMYAVRICYEVGYTALTNIANRQLPAGDYLICGTMQKS